MQYIRRSLLGAFLFGLILQVASAGKAEIKSAATTLGNTFYENIMAFMINFMPYLAAVALVVYGIKYGFGGSKTKKEMEEETEDPLARNIRRILIGIIILGLASGILKVLQAFAG